MYESVFDRDCDYSAIDIQSLTVSVATRTCVIVSDALVLLATWHATYSVKRLADRANVNVPLIQLLLRDGRSEYNL